MTKATKIRVRDLAERVVWTVVASGLSSLVGVAFIDLSAAKAAALTGLAGGLNALTIIARWRLAVLPDPGAGLPGIPTVD